jgi:hypothetical protein
MDANVGWSKDLQFLAVEVEESPKADGDALVGLHGVRESNFANPFLLRIATEVSHGSTSDRSGKYTL